MSDIAKAQEILKNLQSTLSKTEASAAKAEQRRVMTLREAESIEERNRLAVETLTRELAVRREVSLKALGEELEKSSQNIIELKKTRTNIESTISDLARKLEVLRKDEQSLKNSIATLKTDEEALEVIITEQKANIDHLQSEANKQLEKIESNDLTLSELSRAKLQTEQSMETLKAEEGRLENRIIELDAVFKSRKESYDQQLTDTTNRLKTALESLKAADSADKKMRSAWADEHLKLEKRADSVRKMETRVKGLQDRAVELQNYLSI